MDKVRRIDIQINWLKGLNENRFFFFQVEWKILEKPAEASVAYIELDQVTSCEETNCLVERLF